MKVKVTASKKKFNGFWFDKGRIIHNLPDKVAKEWIEDGDAEPYPKPKTKSSKSKSKSS